MAKKQFTVSGMTCSACSSRVEKAVLKTDGVTSCSVNLISGALKVETERECTEAIMSAVTAEGYGIREGIELVKKSEREQKLKKRLVISIPLVVILMYIAMGHMVGLPLPTFLVKPFPFALSQAIIATAVVIINKINGVPVNVSKNLVANIGQLRFRVTGCRICHISGVNLTKVSLRVYKGVK